MVNKQNGQPIIIGRFGGSDKDGVLAIGNSYNLEKRRHKFMRSLSGKHGHSEGIQWYLVTKHSDIGKRSLLLFEFDELESKNKAVDIEKKEIQKYLQKFWEASPLNAAILQREKWFDKLRMKPEALGEES